MSYRNLVYLGSLALDHQATIVHVFTGQIYFLEHLG